MRARSGFLVVTGALALVLTSTSNAFAQSAPAQAAALAQPAAPATVNVHVESDRAVTLFREGEELSDAEEMPPWVDGTADAKAYNRLPRRRMHWFPVCESPCDRDLPLDGNYRLDADGIRPTKVFRLVGRPGERVVVTLDPSTTGSVAAGIVIAGVGAVGVGAGVVLLAGAFGDALLGNHHPQQVDAGLGCLLGGGVVTLVGGIVFFNTRRSSARSLSLPLSKPDAETRASMWRDPRLSTGRAAPHTLPIWSTSF